MIDYDYTPVRSELIEATKRLVLNADRKQGSDLYCVWPEPGDTEWVYATDPRMEPRKIPILRGPKPQPDGSICLEVKQNGIVGMIRLTRLDYLPTPCSTRTERANVWVKEQT